MTDLPFNANTNAGGSLELCAPDKDGFDRNAYLYLKTMTNDPRIENALASGFLLRKTIPRGRPAVGKHCKPPTSPTVSAAAQTSSPAIPKPSWQFAQLTAMCFMPMATSCRGAKPAKRKSSTRCSFRRRNEAAHHFLFRRSFDGRCQPAFDLFFQTASEGEQTRCGNDDKRGCRNDNERSRIFEN